MVEAGTELYFRKEFSRPPFSEKYLCIRLIVLLGISCRVATKAHKSRGACQRKKMKI